MFKNWIKSNILFVNDIIDNKGFLREDNIYTKLKGNTNLISEVSILKKSFPHKWTYILSQEKSRSTKVKTVIQPQCFNKPIAVLTNKQIYNLIIETKFTTPYIHRFWNSHFKENIDWHSQYRFINSLYDNRLKQFKYKLLHRIFPCKEIRFRWKMVDSQNCSLCHVIENYEHVFIDCKL